MVQNPSCWRASSLLFPHWDIKTKRPEPVKLELPLFWCPSAGIIMRSSELWSSPWWMQFKQLHIEAWKSQDFNGVWTRDLTIPVRRSNQLSYEANDVGSWSFVYSNEPVKNGCEVIYMKCFIYWTADLKPLKSWLFQAFIRNCLNCIHNCDDQSSLDFKSTVQYMKHFIYITSQ